MPSGTRGTFSFLPGAKQVAANISNSLREYGGVCLGTCRPIFLDLQPEGRNMLLLYWVSFSYLIVFQAS